MTKGILLVQSRPATPEDPSAFHNWYDSVHIPEILALEGFAGAQRYGAADGQSFVAVYDLDDMDAAQASLGAASKAGQMAPPVGVSMDPPPAVQWLATHTPAG